MTIVYLRKIKSIEYGLVYFLTSKYKDKIHQIKLIVANEVLIDALYARYILAKELLKAKNKLKNYIKRLYNE